MENMDGAYVATVVLTGLIVVFLGLVLLIIFVWLMGKIFDSIKAKKKRSSEVAPPVAETPVVSTPVSAAAAPETEDGISDEIIAVISAAVAAMSDSYTVKSVKKVSLKSSRRTAWGAQGISESTKAF